MTTPEPTSAPLRRRRPWLLAPVLFGLFGSTFTHGSVAALVLLLRAGSGGASGGEGGHSGAGDTTIDVSLAGPAATEPAPPAEAQTTPPAPPPPPVKHTEPPPPEPDPDAVTEPAPPPDTETPPPPPPPAAVAGGGGETTSGGKLPGPMIFAPGVGLGGNTIEGQRSLLPTAVTCKDPVVGIWESLKYNPAHADWVHSSLAVHRNGTAISGTILSHTWSGGPFDRVPPPCVRGEFDMTVSMNASGRDDGKGGITFGSSRYTLLSSKCYAPESTYAPDSFSGKIDATRQEFQSVNNDGANDIDAPYVFRRTGCLDE